MDARADHRERRRIVLGAVCLGFFLIQVDATIMNVALPSIGDDFGGSFAGLQWVIDSYALVLAAGMLMAGTTADWFGARRLFQLGLVTFLIGSAACAAAPDLDSLIAARALQGAGAAALLPCSLALIVHAFPDGRERAAALGVWGGFGSLGMAFGPLLGGIAVELSSWRVVFIVNVPAIVVALLLVARFVRESPRRPRGRTDYGGLVLGTLALAMITGGFIEAGQRGWLGRLPVVLILAGMLVAAGFVAQERRSSNPMLPLDLFRSTSYRAAVGIGLLFNLCAYGTLICLALYLQRTRGESPLETGLTILPMTVLIGVGSVLSGRITARRGPRAPMLIGLGSAGCGAAALSLVGPGSSLALVIAGSLAVGACSLAMPAMTAVALASAPVERAGLASGVLNTARQAGGALGVAVLGSLLLAGSSGDRLDLHSALPVAVAGYLCAIVLTGIATRP